MLSVMSRAVSLSFVALFLTIALKAGVPSRQKQKPSLAKHFLIDPDRPIAYLRFESLGKGIQRFDREPKERIWFRLVNNCRLPIVVQTFGVPDGSPEEEAGVMDEVVPDKALVGSIIEDPPAPALVLPRDSEQEQQPSHGISSDQTAPRGYWFDVSSSDSIEPGGSILFSVPINHLGKQWHMEIPFQFDLPHGKGPRDPVVGGATQMLIWYSAWDLPDKIRKQVVSE